jgi:hypothetical protein
VGGKLHKASVKSSSPCAATDEDLKVTIGKETVVLEQKSTEPTALSESKSQSQSQVKPQWNFENSIEANEAHMFC